MPSTQHVNTGAYIGGHRPKSKTALRQALQEAPGAVTFDVTSAFHTGPTTYTPATIPAGVILDVCGPDPYRDRRFYASVTAPPAAGKPARIR